MSAQKSSATVKLAGLAAAAAMVVLAAAVAVHLAGRRGAPRAAAARPPSGDRVVDLKEQVRHEEFRDGKLHAAIRGDRHFSYPDGRNRLEGSVEITNYGRAGRVVSRLTADRVEYDKDAALFAVSGRVSVEAGGIRLGGDSFEYDKVRGVFRTASGGVFSSAALAGEAREISYVEAADEIRLSGGFRIELTQRQEGNGSLAFSGDSLVYRRSERRGRAEGQAVLSGRRFRGEARSLSFAAAGDEGVIESASLDGASRIVLMGSPPAGPERGTISAGRIDVSFDRDAGLVSSISAEGEARLALRSPAGPEAMVKASAADLTFGPDGEIRQWSASGGFRVDLGMGGDHGRVLEGETAAFAAATGVLRAAGKGDRPAIADSAGARVEAASILAGPAEGDLDAAGSVKCLLKPGEGSRAAGFFSAGEAAYVSSEKLAFRSGMASAHFSGDVQAWQDNEFLLAGELEFSRATGEMRGRGGVAAGLALPAAGGTAGRRVEIGGEAMAFSPSDRALSFTGRSYAQLPGARLEAATVSAILGGEAKAVEALMARTAVVVSRGRYEGRADAAAFRTETGRLTLSGRPLLIDGKGGLTRGDKLTFDLADDKILVENEGQKRSTAVVTS